MQLVLVTPPVVEPLEPNEVKERLGIGDEMSDASVSALITAARQQLDGADGWLGRALNTQTWDLFLDHFPGASYANRERGFHGETRSNWQVQRDYWAGIRLPLAPVQSVVAVTYRDADYTEQTIDASTYVLQGGTPARLTLAANASWPGVGLLPNSVKIRFIAGYGDTGDAVPETIRSAIALQVAYLRSLTARNLFVASEEVVGVGSLRYTVSGVAGQQICGMAELMLRGLRMTV